MKHSYENKGRLTVRESWQLLPEPEPGRPPRKKHPDWAEDAGEFWRRVDRVEKRKDARWGRDIVITLPVELSAAQQKAAIEAFCKENLLSRGMVGT